MAFDLASVPTGQLFIGNHGLVRNRGTACSCCFNNCSGSGGDSLLALLLESDQLSYHALMDGCAVDQINGDLCWLGTEPNATASSLLLLDPEEQLVPRHPLEHRPSLADTLDSSLHQPPCALEYQQAKLYTESWMMNSNDLNDAPCIHPLCLVATSSSSTELASADTYNGCHIETPPAVGSLNLDLGSLPDKLPIKAEPVTNSSLGEVSMSPMTEKQLDVTADTCTKEIIGAAKTDTILPIEQAEQDQGRPVNEANRMEEPDEEQDVDEEYEPEYSQDDEYDPYLDLHSESEEDEKCREKKVACRNEKGTSRRKQTKRQTVEPSTRRSATSYGVQTTYYLKSMFFETYGNNLKLTKAQRRQIQQQTGLKSRNITYWFSNHKRRFHTALQVFRRAVRETDGQVKSYSDFLSWRKQRNLPNEIMDHELL